MRVAESGRLSGHAKAYEFFVPSLELFPLMHKSRPLDDGEGKKRCSASFASDVSFRELMNHVWPAIGVSDNLWSLRGRKVTEARSFAVMDSMTSDWLEGLVLTPLLH